MAPIAECKESHILAEKFKRVAFGIRVCREPINGCRVASSDSRGLLMPRQQWTLDELRDELARFEQDLRAAGLKENSVHTYVDRTDRFLRWLADDYQPRGPRE